MINSYMTRDSSRDQEGFVASIQNVMQVHLIHQEFNDESSDLDQFLVECQEEMNDGFDTQEELSEFLTDMTNTLTDSLGDNEG